MGIKFWPILLLLFLVTPHTIYAGTPAFPGAEGFGANSVGGRGGTVYKVTNTNDSGTGSLRACVSASGPRICIFTVGGLITLNSTLTISNPYITIAGQTAPGGGITLKTTSGDIFTPETHDIIIRYITGRPASGGSNHAVQLADNNSNQIYNIIFDHCSFSWGVDSVWETWYRVTNTTIQWSFVNEGLDCSTHPKGCHSKGLMIGGFKGSEANNSMGSENISVHHNLMAHDAERTPLMQLCGVAQVVNNVTYNPKWSLAHQQLNCIGSGYEGTSYVNWINNYFKNGPSGDGSKTIKIIPRDTDSDDPWSGVCSSGKAYMSGNVLANGTISTEFSGACVAKKNEIITTVEAVAPALTVTNAQTAYDQVLAEGGNSKGVDCAGNWYSRRDSIDTRVVNEVKTGTGKIINSPTEVGGWVTPAIGTPCVDSDNDGIPNDYETANPNATIEDYINGVAGQVTKKIGDVNGDDKVNILDIGIVIDYFGSDASAKPEANLNGDFLLNLIDIGIIVDNYE